MARIAPILIVTFAVLWAACGSDLNSKVPDSGWQLEESMDIATTSPTPEGLPQDYINHPANERRFPGAQSTVCDVPPGYTDGNPSDGKMIRPIVGTIFIMGLSPQEFEPLRVEYFNYNIFFRFPHKSDMWHRFEVRRSAPRTIFNATFRFAWDETQAPLLFFQPNTAALIITLAMPDCDLPTQEDLDQFIFDYSEIDIIFHNPTTNAVYRFAPREPDGIRVNEPRTVLHNNTPVMMTWDLPINRPKQRIPEFMEARD